MGNFEERLLTVLKDEVEANAASATTARRPRARLAWAAGLAGVTAVAALGVTAGVTVLTEKDNAAYAVEKEPDGEIRVSVFEWEAFDDLERELREDYGVDADFTYLTGAERCAEPRASSFLPGDDPRVREIFNRYEATVEDGSLYIHLDPSAVEEGETLLFTVMHRVVDDEVGVVSIGMEVATSEVGPCVITTED